MKFLKLVDLVKIFLTNKQEKNNMAKVDVVAGGVVSVQAAQAQGLSDGPGAFYDAVVADIPANPPGSFSQADIDAAVLAKGISDQAAVDALTGQVSALQADDDAKSKIIAGIKALLP